MAGGNVSKMLSADKIMALLQAKPVYCGDFQAGELSKKLVQDVHQAEVFDQTAAGAAQNFLHLAKDRRVSYFDLRPETQPSGREWLKMHIELAPISATLVSGKEAKQLQPIFYLPYKQNGMTRMKLRTPPGYNGEEVRFFATATINGCSVYIEGDPANPKVTHANASAYATFAGSATWAEKSQKIGQKSTFMDQRFAPLRSQVATVVDRPMYMASAGNHIDVARQTFATRMGVPLDNVYADTYNPIGAVVGLKGDNGNWTFYLQKSVSFGFRNRKGTYLDGYIVLQANEIWPHGAGLVRML
jgi:hypothetical protein